MNRDTICVQGGYTPGNGEPRQSKSNSIVCLERKLPRNH